MSYVTHFFALRPRVQTVHARQLERTGRSLILWTECSSIYRTFLSQCTSANLMHIDVIGRLNVKTQTCVRRSTAIVVSLPERGGYAKWRRGVSVADLHALALSTIVPTAVCLI